MATKILKFKVVFTLHKLEIETKLHAPEILIAVEFGSHDVKSTKFKSRDKVFILQETLTLVTDLFVSNDGKLQPKPCKIVLYSCEGEKSVKVASISLDLSKSLKMPPKIECGRFSSKKQKGLLLYELSFKQLSEETIHEEKLDQLQNNLTIHQESVSNEFVPEEKLQIVKEESPKKEGKMGILDKDEESEKKGEDLPEQRSIRSETPVFEISEHNLNIEQSKENEKPHETLNTIKKNPFDSQILSETHHLQEELSKAKESLVNLQNFSILQEKATTKSITTIRELELENHELKTLAIRMEEELRNKGLLLTKMKSELQQFHKENKRLEKALQKTESFHKNWTSKQSDNLSSSQAKTKELHSQLLSAVILIRNEVYECLKAKEEIEDGDESGLASAQLFSHLNRSNNRLAELETMLKSDEGPKIRNLTEEMYKRKWQEAENEIIRLKTKFASVINVAYEFGNQSFLDYIRNELN